MKTYFVLIVKLMLLMLILTSLAYPLDPQYNEWLKNGFPQNPEKGDVEIFLLELHSEYYNPNRIESIEKIRDRFIKEYGIGDSTISTLDLVHKVMSVDKFWIEDINDDGELELIAIVNTGTWAGSLYIVYNDRKNFRFQEIFGVRNPEISKLGDGKGKQIILYKPLTEYQGARYPMAFWPQIYEWNGKEMAESSNYFEYYKNEVIPNAKKKIEEIEKDPHASKEDKEVLISLQKIVINKAKRFTKMDEEAYFKEAQEWFNSNNQVVRENALDVFKDIGNEESFKIIQKAQEDKDPWIASKAKISYEYLKAKKAKGQ